MVAIVTYDLHNPGRTYQNVEKVLKAAGSWRHPQGSVWLVDTLLTVSTLRDQLKDAADSNDEFFVGRLASRTWATYNTDKDTTSWLHDSARHW